MYMYTFISEIFHHIFSYFYIYIVYFRVFYISSLYFISFNAPIFILTFCIVDTLINQFKRFCETALGSKRAIYTRRNIAK